MVIFGKNGHFRVQIFKIPYFELSQSDRTQFDARNGI